MALEIERKFLVTNSHWRDQIVASHPMQQGYLQRKTNAAIRIRISGTKAHINIKQTDDGIHRLEYEYDIPLNDAQEMLDKIAEHPLIEKIRHHVTVGKHLWEIDEFLGDNQGLVVAEIELASADEPFERPDWLGAEVSTDRRYFNSALIAHPYKDWVDF